MYFSLLKRLLCLLIFAKLVHGGTHKNVHNDGLSDRVLVSKDEHETHHAHHGKIILSNRIMYFHESNFAISTSITNN